MTSALQSFAAWMNGLSPLSVASHLALTFVELWFALLAHELGHAAVGLTRTEGLVRVRVGRSPGLWRARLGRLSLELHPFPARTEPDGIARTHAHFGQASALLYTLAGPAAGCSAAVLLILAGLRAGSEPLAVIGGLVFVSEVSNLLPSTRHGTGSDGARLRELFRTKRADHAPHPLADVETRWLVLVTDAKGALADRSGGLLLKVLNALDRDPRDRNEEAVALVRTAFSGWCWREAEQADTKPIRHAVLDARHRAALRGVARADIAGMAADELARDVDLAVASPTPDSLDYGFRRALRGSFTRGVPAEHAQFAFRFGVAMHDVVSIAG